MKKHIPNIIRIIISILFIISAIAKLYPSPYFAITTFEAKQLIPLGFSSDLAVYFSRFLIGIELALGIAILQPNYLKKLVVPSTIILLVVFCLHLSYDIFVNGGSGNCGCFGELIPMTPMQALIKNLISIILLVYLFVKIDYTTTLKNRFSVLLIIFLTSSLFMFVIAPIKSSNKIVVKKNISNNINSLDSTYVNIINEIDANVDKHILCFFAPTCDHCMQAARSLDSLSKITPNFPAVHIVFMDEGVEEIPKFFQFAGAESPYEVMDVAKFWEVIGFVNNTPGVVYINKGKIIKFYQGIEDDKFEPASLIKELNFK